MKAAVTALALLVGCGSHAYCTTRCGLVAATPTDCSEFQAQEDTVLSVLDARGILQYAPSCAAVAGYEVAVASGLHDGGGELVWTDSWGRQVAGETDCVAGKIAVTNTDWDSEQNALSHELVHAIEGCADGPNGESHYRWHERGIVAAIDAARPEP